MKKYIFLMSSILMLWNSQNSFCQGNEEVRAYNYVTFYYLDNSEGFDADFMNSEMSTELKDNIDKLASRTDNYFLLYACNGENHKIVNDLKAMSGGGSTSFLKKYLSKASKEANYDEDKTALRENLCEYPVKTKQNVEINYYLSSNALKKLLKEINELPTPITFTSEFLTYIDGKDMKIKMNIFVDKRDAEKIGAEKIKSYFTFCSSIIDNSNIQTDLIGL